MVMRIRHLRIDPVVVGIALVVTVVALLGGAGFAAIVAGTLTLGAAVGMRPLTVWLARRWTLPPSDTLERSLVLRSRNAANAMRRISRAVPDGPVAQRCREMERNARTALPTIRDLAFQACSVRSLASNLVVGRLEAERSQTQALLAGHVDERVRIEMESSLRSTEAQLATGRRLQVLADELSARTGALTNSMEAIAAGLAELFALSSADPTAQPKGALATLSHEIDALRAGLEEAQTFGRRAAAVHLLEE
jgi:hypothetical protein